MSKLPKGNVNQLPHSDNEGNGIMLETHQTESQKFDLISILAQIMGLNPPRISKKSSGNSDLPDEMTDLALCHIPLIFESLNLPKSILALFSQMKQKFFKKEKETVFSLQTFIMFLKDHQFSVPELAIMSQYIALMKQPQVELSASSSMSASSFLMTGKRFRTIPEIQEEIKDITSGISTIDSQISANNKESSDLRQKLILYRTKITEYTGKNPNKVDDYNRKKKNAESKLEMLDNEPLKSQLKILNDQLKILNQELKVATKKNSSSKSSGGKSEQKMQVQEQDEESEQEQEQENNQGLPNCDLFSMITNARIPEIHLLYLFLTAMLCRDDGIEQYTSREFKEKMNSDSFSTLISLQPFVNFTLSFFSTVHQMNHRSEGLLNDCVSVSQDHLDKEMKSFFLQWYHYFNTSTDKVEVPFEKLLYSVMKLLTMTLNNIGFGRLSTCNELSVNGFNCLAMINIVLERIFGKSNLQEDILINNFFQRVVVVVSKKGSTKTMFSLKDLDQTRFSACVTNFLTRRDEILYLNGIADRSIMYDFVSMLFKLMNSRISRPNNLLACLSTHVGSGKTFVLTAFLGLLLEKNDTAFILTACPEDVLNFFAKIYFAVSEFVKSPIFTQNDEPCKAAFQGLLARLSKISIHMKPLAAGITLKSDLIHVFILLPTPASKSFLKSLSCFPSNNLAFIWCDDFDGWDRLLEGMSNIYPTIVSGADMTCEESKWTNRSVLTCSNERIIDFPNLMKTLEKKRDMNFSMFISKIFGNTVDSFSKKLLSMGIHLKEVENAESLQLPSDSTDFFTLLKSIAQDYNIAFQKIMLLYQSDSFRVDQQPDECFRRLVFETNIRYAYERMASLLLVPDIISKNTSNGGGSSSKKLPFLNTSRDDTSTSSSNKEESSSTKSDLKSRREESEDFEFMKSATESTRHATISDVLKRQDSLIHDPRFLTPGTSAKRDFRSLLANEQLSLDDQKILATLFDLGIGIVWDRGYFSQQYIIFVTSIFKKNRMSFLFTNFALPGLNLGYIETLILNNDILWKIFRQLFGRLDRPGQSKFGKTLHGSKVYNLSFDRFSPHLRPAHLFAVDAHKDETDFLLEFIGVPVKKSLIRKQYDFSSVLVKASDLGIQTYGNHIFNMLGNVFTVIDSEFDKPFLQRLEKLIKACLTRLFSESFNFRQKTTHPEFDGTMILGHIFDQSVLPPSFSKKSRSMENVFKDIIAVFGKGTVIDLENDSPDKKKVIFEFFNEFSHILKVLRAENKEQDLSLFSTIKLINAFLEELKQCSILLECMRSLLSGLTTTLDSRTNDYCFCRLDTLAIISLLQVKELVSLLESKRNKILEAENKRNEEFGTLLKNDAIANLKRDLRNRYEVLKSLVINISEWFPRPNIPLEHLIHALMEFIVKNIPEFVMTNLNSKPTIQDILHELVSQKDQMIWKAKQVSDVEVRRTENFSEMQHVDLLMKACEFYISINRMCPTVQRVWFDWKENDSHLSQLVPAREKLQCVVDKMKVLNAQYEQFSKLKEATFKVGSTSKEFLCLQELKTQFGLSEDSVVFGKKKPGKSGDFFEASLTILPSFYNSLCLFMHELRLEGLSQITIFHPEPFEEPRDNQKSCKEVSKESLAMFFTAVTDLEGHFATLLVDVSPYVKQIAELTVQIDERKRNISMIESTIDTFDTQLSIFRMA